MSALKPSTTLLKLAACLLLSFASAGIFAQDVYRARLSPMPVTPQTVNSITGVGEVILTLSGSTLSVAGSFEGMSSTATMVHIHNGPMAQPGPVAYPLEITKDAKGNITGAVELNDEHLQALQDNALYIQVHSEGNPAGELRGWIFLRK